MENEDYIKSLEKKYAKGVISNGLSITQSQKTVIPFSPSVDLLLGAGIESGSFLNLSGFSGVGKTVSALHFAARCQEEKYGSRDVIFIDIENRLRQRQVNCIPRLNKEKFFHVHSTKDRFLSGQDFITIMEDTLKTQENVVMIVDSYSMLSPEKEMAGGVEASTRGSGGAAYSILPGFFRRMAQVVPVMGSIVVGIQQMMKDPSGYSIGSEKGGESIRFAADYHLRATKATPWKDKDGNIIGQVINWKCMKTGAARGGAVGSERESHLRYGLGIDEVREIMPIAEEVGFLVKSGAWYYTKFAEAYPELTYEDRPLGKAKFQGVDNLVEAFEQNPQWLEILQKEIKSAYGVS